MRKAFTKWWNRAALNGAEDYEQFPQRLAFEGGYRAGVRAAVPKGFVVVPETLTPEMATAMYRRGSLNARWAAVLEAAANAQDK